MTDAHAGYEGSDTSRPDLADDRQGILSIAKSVHSENKDFTAEEQQNRWGFFGYSFDDLRHAEVNGGWFFHGQGQEPYFSCGEYTFKGCLNQDSHPGKAYIKKIKHNCGRAQCPVCHESWLVETTKKVEHRIVEAQKVLIKFGWRRHNPIHVTVNPGPEHWDLFLDVKNYNKLRRKAQQIAKKAGFNGGSIIYHPERSRCGKCGGKLIGKKFDKHCKSCNSKEIAWYFSPHWHLFGFGWILNTREISESTGYVVKNHGIRTSIGATVYYQLSHCGLREGKQTYTWFGILHYSKLHIPPAPVDPADIECPLCGHKIRLVRYEGTKPPPLDDNEGQVLDSMGWKYRHER